MPAQSVYVELYHLFFYIVRPFHYYFEVSQDSPSAEVMAVGVRLVNDLDGRSSSIQTRVDVPLRFRTLAAQ
jgi:hypothetical protein